MGKLMDVEEAHKAGLIELSPAGVAVGTDEADSLILDDDGHEEESGGRHHRLDLRSQVAKPFSAVAAVDPDALSGSEELLEKMGLLVSERKREPGDFLPFPAKAVLSHDPTQVRG